MRPTSTALFRRSLPSAILLTLTCLSCGTRPLSAAEPSPPNVVLILIDDLGWRDIGPNGNTIYHTPHLDRLAREGMRFTDAYAACNCCSPTRASVLTGRYPARLHVTDWIPGSSWPWTRLRAPDWIRYLPLEEVTIAEALKPSGYATAHVGKWHLGGEEFSPEAQGFDVNFGGCSRGAPSSYFAPYGIPPIDSAQPDQRGEFLTERVTDEAIRFVREHREDPFFLYLSYYTVHRPLQARGELIQSYLNEGRPNRGATNATFAAMVQHMDEGVGRMLQTLDDLEIADRTVVFFTSDNGGMSRKLEGAIDPQRTKHCVASTTNEPLREGKGSCYEGGSRVPLIVRWPGIVAPGSVCHEPVISIDFFPTILEIAQAAAPPDRVVDGQSLMPLLRQQGDWQRDAIFWHYPHYNVAGQAGTRPHGIVRCGDWKLIEFYEDQRIELYNLAEDLSETRDLAADLPDRASELRTMLHRWRAAVGAQMPDPNPNHDEAKAREIYQWWDSLPTR